VTIRLPAPSTPRHCCCFRNATPLPPCPTSRPDAGFSIAVTSCVARHDHGAAVARCDGPDACESRSGRQAAAEGVFAHAPNGVNGMTGVQIGRVITANLLQSLKPLAKHKGDFTVFSGLHHPNGLGQAHVCAEHLAHWRED